MLGHRTEECNTSYIAFVWKETVLCICIYNYFITFLKKYTLLHNTYYIHCGMHTLLWKVDWKWASSMSVTRIQVVCLSEMHLGCILQRCLWALSLVFFISGWCFMYHTCKQYFLLNSYNFSQGCRLFLQRIQTSNSMQVNHMHNTFVLIWSLSL